MSEHIDIFGVTWLDILNRSCLYGDYYSVRQSRYDYNIFFNILHHFLETTCTVVIYDILNPLLTSNPFKNYNLTFALLKDET